MYVIDPYIRLIVCAGVPGSSYASCACILSVHIALEIAEPTDEPSVDHSDSSEITVAKS
jgi:hypothetical protein